MIEYKADQQPKIRNNNLYHDYMQLPPEEKRERHFIVKFQLPND